MSSEQWRGTRRELLSAAGIGAAVYFSTCFFPYDSRPKDRQKPLAEKSLSELTWEIHEIEKKFGDQKLSFNAAKKYIPILTEHFTKSTQASTSGEDFTNHVFIVRDDDKDYAVQQKELDELANDQRDPQTVSVIQQLYSDYPSLRLADEEASRIAQEIGLRDAGGFVYHDNVYIILNSLNDTKAFSTESITDSNGITTHSITEPIWQYNGFGAEVSCLTPRPVVYFRTAIYHELTHLDNPNSKRITTNENFLDAYSDEQRIVFGIKDPNDRLYKDTQYTKGYIDHFGAVVTNDHIVSGAPSEHFLEELTADYFAGKVSANSGLDYSLAYGQPYDFYNLSQVVHQSGISDRDFYLMHRDSRLEEFLLKIGQGAKDVDLPTQKDQFRFAIDRLLFSQGNPIGFYPPIRWDKFVPYFDEIDTRIYQYVQDPLLLQNPFFFNSTESVEYMWANSRISCRK